MNRRRFLATTGTALALPTIVPRSVLGFWDQPAPGNRVTLGVIGFGGQGAADAKAFLRLPECRLIAVSDCDQNHLQKGIQTINHEYNNNDCQGYRDFRELIARKDIDAVLIATPDHWHALAATESAEQGKDIYGEKPLAHTIAEQQAIVRAVEKNGRIWQTGSWQRSVANFHKAAEIVANGLIGKVTHVEVGLPAGHKDYMDGVRMTVSDPPATLDYDRWIGPAAMMPYIEGRVHKNWRWNYNTGGGSLLDWVGHHCDIAHWGLGFDRTGPLEAKGRGEFPAQDAVWNTCTKYWIDLKYPQDITMVIAGGYPEIRVGTKWIGKDGWVYVDRGKFEASNPEWSEERSLPEELRKVKLYQSDNHFRNFLDCVKSRKPTITPVQTAHHSTIPGHLGLISMWVGRPVKWDNDAEKILADQKASELMSRTYRPPYHLA